MTTGELHERMVAAGCLERSKPGPEIAAGQERTARGTGQADAVAYLAGRYIREVQVVEGVSRLVEQTMTPSLEMRALRYLRPCSETWYEKHPGLKRGIHRPWAIEPSLPEGLRTQAKETNQEILWQFSAEDPNKPGADWDAALRANAPEHMPNWRWIKVEDGIWAGFYVA